MQKVPYDICAQYVAFLKAKVKDISQHKNLKKWFLYFWDFLAKYSPIDSKSEQVRLFIYRKAMRTIQTLLGHSDVRTTMIYTHCMPSKTVKELKSPLDF